MKSDTDRTMTNDKQRRSREHSRQDARRAFGRVRYLWKIPLRLLGQVARLLIKHPYALLAIVAAIALAAVIPALRKPGGLFSAEIPETLHIGATATQIQDIREIRQWEALAIECEEMTDTAEERFFGDKALTRIYAGTLRLGVDMREASGDWFTAKGDTAVLKLPPITLLNPDFIDEARTRTFIEEGDWNAETYEALYRKAREKMLRRSFGKGQRQQAAQNIAEKFRSLFLAFGYRHVEISWGGAADKSKNKEKGGTPQQ